MDRGEQREGIVHDDEDRQGFVETLMDGGGNAGRQIRAYGLMLNQFYVKPS
jgi:hypothetical protein